MRNSRRQVRCTICTPHRWLGNAKGRFKGKEEILRKETKITNSSKHNITSGRTD